jgi:hypothetical protein
MRVPVGDTVGLMLTVGAVGVGVVIRLVGVVGVGEIVKGLVGVGEVLIVVGATVRVLEGTTVIEGVVVIGVCVIGDVGKMVGLTEAIISGASFNENSILHPGERAAVFCGDKVLVSLKRNIVDRARMPIHKMESPRSITRKFFLIYFIIKNTYSQPYLESNICASIKNFFTPVASL